MRKIHAAYLPHMLDFKFDAGTSRGIMKKHQVWFLVLTDQDNQQKGIGEVAPLPDLSLEDPAEIPRLLDQVCLEINANECFNADALLTNPSLHLFPSVKFGLETAMQDLSHHGRRLIFDNDFYIGQHEIPINGLVWMGPKSFMESQIREKIKAGFRCIKLKIGGIRFQEELDLLKFIRQEFDQDLVIRLDANGSFEKEEALDKLKRLSAYQIHSIEQPVKPNQRELMAALCAQSPVPIALDEELIGMVGMEEKQKLINDIRPHYLILKPTLLGGFASCKEWIHVSNSTSSGWWLTSALESNIGLNAICQFAAELNVVDYQGLGTGQLYHNNINSPLVISNGKVTYNPQEEWDLTKFERGFY